MPLLLRKIEKRRWDWIDIPIEWLPAGEVPAAPLRDLNTSVDCRLSVWYIEEDNSNLEYVVAALAATLDHIDKFDYTLFDMGVLGGVGIRAEVSRGGSKDQAANDRWHRNLVQLSASQLVILVRLIHQHGQRGRFLEDRVKELIEQAVRAGRIDKTRLHDRLLKDVFSV